MTQYSLIKKFNDEGMNAMQIHRCLVEIFEDDSLSYQSVTYHLRKKSWTPKNEDDENKGGRPANYRIDALILKELKENSNQGYRKIAQKIGYDPSSVYYVLTSRLKFKSYHLKWIPHELTFEQNLQRVAISKELLDILTKTKKKWMALSHNRRRVLVFLQYSSWTCLA